MNVRLDGGLMSAVDVHAYLINVPSSPHNAQTALAVWARISQKINDEVHAANAAHPRRHASRAGLIAAIDPLTTDGLLAAVPLGKGSPAAIKVYLRLAVRYGLSTRQGLGAFVGAANRDVGLD